MTMTAPDLPAWAAVLVSFFLLGGALIMLAALLAALQYRRSASA